MTFWEYLAEVTPDYDYTLTIEPQREIPFDGNKNQRLRFADDGTPHVYTASSVSSFLVTLQFHNKSAAVFGELWDLFHDPYRANGMARTWRWTNKAESPSRTYTVRFASSIPARVFAWGQHQALSVRIIVEGRAPAS